MGAGFSLGIPLEALRRYFLVMWAGFWVNAFSGVLLLIAYPTKALTNPDFYLKLLLIAGGLLILRATLRRVRAGLATSGTTKLLAAVSLLVWAAAITSGRLLAYTCIRLTVDTPCE